MRRGIGRLRAGGSGFSPLSLFASGEQGVWYDPSDFSTMFQDSAGTTPVTAVGQPVGKILDKSGRGNHATQFTTTSRPLLQQDGSGFYYLNFDGVDDSLATGNINLTATAKATHWVGVTKSSDAGNSCLFEFGATSANNGTFAVFAPGGAAPNYNFQINGTGSNVARNATTYTAPISNVLSCAVDLGAAANLNILPRINGVVPTLDSSLTALGGNFSNAALNIARRNNTNLPFIGRIYQLVVRGATSSAAEIAATERFVGSKMGIAL